MAITISKIIIKRFRSINDLTLHISNKQNIITICGENNVGKTNILRAINLFFDKTDFSFYDDVPEFKQKTMGATIYPEITLDFLDNKTNSRYVISKNYDIRSLTEETAFKYVVTGTKDGSSLDEKESIKFLNSIHLFYLPSINLSFPETINYLIDDKFLDIEFGKTQMRGKKGEVKTNLENARIILQEILDDLTNSINENFKDFHPSWGIKFLVPKNINRFRELITQEVEFTITDDTQTLINTKGAGLQRLGHILLNLRIIEKLSATKKNQHCIILIDEPDIYLHHRLQKKLKECLDKISLNTQVFLTTHSPIFINAYSLENLFLLKLDVESKFSTRKKETSNSLNTCIMDLKSNDAVSLIKETLGISDKDNLIVSHKNILVEGEGDKKYIEELCNFFKFPCRNIISADGVTNFKTYLEYYNSLVEKDSSPKPIFKVLFDNDEAGREEYSKILKNKNNYQNIEVKLEYVIDSFKSDFSRMKNPKPNIEIEDLIYPEIILTLSNEILARKKGFKKISERRFLQKIDNLSLRYKGVLEIIDNLKNEKNAELGITFSTKDSSFKGGLAGRFEVRGNSEMIDKLSELDKKYPEVKIFLKELFQ